MSEASSFVFDPVVTVPNGYSITVTVRRPADEVSRVRLTYFDQPTGQWMVIYDGNTDPGHYGPFRIYGPVIPIGGTKLQLEAWNRWNTGAQWPMTGDRINYPNKVLMNFTVEPGQSTTAMYVEFVMERVVYAIVEADQEFNIAITSSKVANVP